MKRTNTILLSVATVVSAVAITAGPAAAATGYEWLNQSGEPSGASQPTQSDYSSVNAILNGPGATGGAIGSDRSAAPAEGAGYGSLNSIVGTDPVPTETVSVVHAGSGFSWEDAFIGAGAALVVMLLSAMTAYEVRRHRRVTVASGA
jgi:hypothetical protein